LRNDIRSFALDGVRDVKPAGGKVKDVTEPELDRVLASGYGIFSGAKVQWAALRFTPARARYISLEEWHPKQRSRLEKDGSYVLEIPYSSQTELVGDILKWGEEVEVLSPKELRDAVARKARATAKLYG
jgi:predicted DNA-binding transcriptional regulator YafY